MPLSSNAGLHASLSHLLDLDAYLLIEDRLGAGCFWLVDEEL